MSKPKYVTFPVALLKDAFVDIEKVCKNAVNYAIYSKAKTVDGMEEALRYYRIINHNCTIENLYEECQILHDSFEGLSSPMVSLNRDTLIQFMNQPKSEFEIAVFCAFCGIRSIIGKKQYVKTNNNFLIARMFGCRSMEEFDKLEIKPNYWYWYFSTDKKMRNNLTDKIIKYSLVLDWGLKYYSGRNRGFYISFELQASDLKLLAEKTTWAYKQKEYQKKQAESLL